ncbi:hypothetical protein L249_3821 [Ophiocordyceps polyrhachis-furcata BCC 54312]|uniref:PPM-type phosphatase domain-containing protein n=1 Tax=Ophiocordyceps polyrhachis-furcata BCC 54312 TaxID=1330021 RepID=A0A367L5F8_9HYPO|nr:hypothetical protein L249_3821 [Ophiocordyceps polyrhachis-furcata BCC 54312]
MHCASSAYSLHCVSALVGGRRRRYSTAASAIDVNVEEPAPNPVKFTYHLGAAYASKDGKVGHLHHSAHAAGKHWSAGEDAFFISSIGAGGYHSFGVADGVGGCKSDDVDPADFSRGICDSMAHFCSHGKIVPPSRLMQVGYDAVCEQKRAQGGGSTACVAVVDPRGIVEVANLGDSGFLHLRPNAIIYRSKGQSHGFNAPFQLRCPKLAGASPGDGPDDADIFRHTVRHGDILILATDGLFDNQYCHDILGRVNNVMFSNGAWQPTQSSGVSVSDDLRELMGINSGSPLQTELARVLTLAARTASLSKVDGPFAKMVQKYDPAAHYFGGKRDDITVVVAIYLNEIEEAMDVYVAGAVAAFTVDVIVYPLDTYKTRLQSRDFLKAAAPKGGLYQGIGVVVVATLPAAGVFFSTYERCKRLLASSEVLPLAVVHASASSVAEAASCLVLAPAEVIKQNAQMLKRSSSSSSAAAATTSSSSSSSSSASIQAFRRLGVSRLFSGYTALVARNLPFTAMQFPIYEHVRARLRRGRKRDALVETGFTAGVSAGVAGATAAFLTTPGDVVKTRIMVTAGQDRRLGSWAVIKAVWAERGVRGFFRGAGLRSGWTALGSSLYLGSYDMARLWLGKGESYS